MKMEAGDSYDEFIRSAIVELLKTITIKMSVSDTCNRLLENWVSNGKNGFPDYGQKLPIVTNK